VTYRHSGARSCEQGLSGREQGQSQIQIVSDVIDHDRDWGEMEAVGGAEPRRSCSALPENVHCDPPPPQQPCLHSTNGAKVSEMCPKGTLPAVPPCWAPYWAPESRDWWGLRDSAHWLVWKLLALRKKMSLCTLSNRVQDGPL
jgi:hypothetical protein